MRAIKILFLLIIILFTCSCSKDEIDTKPAISESKGIFICGIGWENGKVVPRLWINSNIYNYENNGNGGIANDMAFLGSEIYTVGWIYNTDGSFKTHVVWKNSKILTELTNTGFPVPFAIATNENNNDIYVVGLEQQPGEWAKAKIWKNGIKSSISTTDGAMPFDIEIRNNIVYIVGCIPQSNIDIAVVWKNGIPTFLTDGTHDAVATSLTIINDDIYVAGKEKSSNGNYIAKYWKNGEATNLTDGTFDALTTTIVVKNNIVYVAGSEYNTNGKQVAKYWKNGVQKILSDGIELAK